MVSHRAELDKINMEETTQTTAKENYYFTTRHLLFYLMLIPAIIFNYFIFNLVLNNSENLNLLFNFKQLLTLLALFSGSFAFSGITLYFLKKNYEIIVIAIVLTIPIFIVKLTFDQTILAVFALLVTYITTGLILKKKVQKYIVPNLQQQISSSFKLTTLLLNLSLTFIFFTQVSLIPLDTWVGNINKILTPITKAVTNKVEKSMLPQKQLIGQAQNLAGSNLMQLNLNQLEKAININEIQGMQTSGVLSLDEVLQTPSPSDIIQSQIKSTLTQYQQFLPVLAALIAFINYQIILNFAILFSSILITIIVFLLKLLKIIKIKKELKEITIYEI